jgi:hypothetical protein
MYSKNSYYSATALEFTPIQGTDEEATFSEAQLAALLSAIAAFTAGGDCD